MNKSGDGGVKAEGKVEKRWGNMHNVVALFFHRFTAPPILLSLLMNNLRRPRNRKPNLEALGERVVFSNLPIAESLVTDDQALVDNAFSPGGFCTPDDANRLPLDDLFFDYDREAWQKLGGLAHLAALLDVTDSQNVYALSGPGSIFDAAGLDEAVYYVEHGRVLVSAVTNLESVGELASALADHNVEITGQYGHVVEGWIDPKDLKSLADIKELILLQPVSKPFITPQDWFIR